MKTIITLAITAASIAAYAQTTTTVYLAGQSRSETMRNLVTGQYGKGTIVTPPTTMVADNSYINGADKFSKTPVEGNRNKQFEVYDIAGKSKKSVVRGLLTASLDKDTRYADMGPKPVAIELSLSGIEYIDIASQNVTAGMQEKISGFRNMDKYFVILGDGDYRYIDGKSLAGDKTLVEELKKGKPITVTTFFYELQAAGIADKNMTVTEFTRLTTDEQLDIVSAGYFGNKTEE